MKVLCVASVAIVTAEPAQSRKLFIDAFGLPLRRHDVTRDNVSSKPGFPDRVELRDLEVGEPALLLNLLHQPANTPYRASHAIFVHEGATTAFEAVDKVPDVIRIRPISLRAFSAAGEMVDADLVDGRHIETLIDRFLANIDVSYLQAHYAKRGCYAAHIERA